MIFCKDIGHIKNHQNFKILFWSRESEKPIFTIFRNFYEKKSGIRESRVRRRFRKSRVRRRRPGIQLDIWPGFRRDIKPDIQPDIWQGAVVSLVIAGRRRLTRDSRNRRLTRDSRIPDFSRQNFPKNRKNRFFGLPVPK